MALRNDFPLRGFEDRTAGWAVGPGYNLMGNIPNTDNTPWYFKQPHPDRLGQTLRAILPLLVLFDGSAHSATNTRVHFRNMRLYIKSRSTQQWVSYGVSPGVSGYNTQKTSLFAGSEAEDKRINADGSVEIKPPVNQALAWHGWWNLGRVSIQPNDIEAVFVTLQARLTVDNPALADDRAAAQLGIHVGADYYLDPSTSWDVIIPAVALSRTKRITNSWQAFSAMTFSDVGVQEPGGGITQAAFRAAPPPLE